MEVAENGSLAVDGYNLRITQGRPFDIVLVSLPRLSGMRTQVADTDGDYA